MMSISEIPFPEILDSEVVEWLVSDRFLFSNEIRRREAVLEILGAIAKRSPGAFTEAVMRSCRSDIQRRMDCRSVFRRDDRAETSTEASIGYPDAEGWGSLETSVKAFRTVLQCTAVVESSVWKETEHIVQRLVVHTNRFVREHGQLCLAELIRIAGGEYNEALFLRLFSHISAGLQDNWSQVRYTSLTASRSAFREVQRRKVDLLVLESIVPHILINRHYVAEGVRRYAQETWLLLVGPQGGVPILANWSCSIISCLNDAMQSLNHSVREAAASCLSEILSKVLPELDPIDLGSEKITTILSICISGLEDDSWTVREMGVKCCLVLYQTTLPRLGPAPYDVLFSRIEYIVSLLLQDVFDPMLPLRQHSSECLGFMISLRENRFPNPKSWSHTLSILREKILTYLSYEESLESYSSAPAKNRFTSHENRPMYSCGTLTTNTSIRRIQHSTSDDCCAGGSCNISVDSQPWDICDGAIRLYGAILRSELLSCDHAIELNNVCLPLIASVVMKPSRRKYANIMKTARTVFDGLTFELSSLSVDAATGVQNISEQIKAHTG